MKLKIVSLYLIVFAFVISAQNNVLWIYSGSVADYSYVRSLGYGLNDLGGSTSMHYEADAFVNQLNSRINAGYPSISTSTRQDKDLNFTKSVFTSHFLDNYEICMFGGHGSPFNFYPYDYRVPINDGSVNFGGNYTKWVFFNSCSTLNSTTATDYLPAFNGCHAILGNHAKGYVWFQEYCKWKYWLFGWQCGEKGTHHTYDQWEYFATNWCDNYKSDPGNNGLWDSYNKAVNQSVYQECLKGIAPAIVWIWGYCPLTNQYGNGRNEHFTSNNSQFMWPVSSNSYFQYSGICYYWEAHGNPSY